MYEVFAIAAGVVLGLVAQKSANTRLKVAVLVLGSVIVGTGPVGHGIDQGHRRDDFDR